MTAAKANKTLWPSIETTLAELLPPPGVGVLVLAADEKVCVVGVAPILVIVGALVVLF